MDNKKIEINKEDLICSICKEPFIEPIFIPSCGHHSCRACLIQLMESDIDNNRKCSVCLVPFNNIMTNDYLNTVKSNFMLSNLKYTPKKPNIHPQESKEIINFIKQWSD